VYSTTTLATSRIACVTMYSMPRTTLCFGRPKIDFQKQSWFYISRSFVLHWCLSSLCSYWKMRTTCTHTHTYIQTTPYRQHQTYTMVQCQRSPTLWFYTCSIQTGLLFVYPIVQDSLLWEHQRGSLKKEIISVNYNNGIVTSVSTDHIVQYTISKP